ncbi:MAG TPA: Cof-type HAD-IIB family hydrolase [Clostridiales bacterium]|nr:Cof-type HAD-IIB family hydrolase [Clostridiales bacterium]
MKYKMVVLDLDGTLLDDKKQISEKNTEILTYLHKNNIETIIATGRNYYMAKMLTDKIKDIHPVILANNGAIIRRSHNDELIEYNYLKSSEFEKIYYEGLKFNLNPVLHVDEYFNGYDLIYECEDYEKAYFGYIKKDYNRAKLMKFKPGINNILSICYFDEYDRLYLLGNEMEKQGKGRFNIIYNMNIGRRSLLEFLHPDGCKWSALKKYTSRLNIAAEEIIAIGDDNNDIELLRNSGLGIAMKNGTAESMKAAKEVSAYDNNNSGVYYALSEIFN